MKKILIIEDEVALQKMLGEVLAEKGYEVIQSLDGESGLALAISGKPDLILLDLILPKIKGLGVLKKIRENEIIKDTPVIILTNSENAADIEEAISLGTTAYLVKANYSIKEIMEKVEKYGNKSSTA